MIDPIWVVNHAREIAIAFLVFFGACIIGAITIIILDIKDWIKERKK